MMKVERFPITVSHKGVSVKIRKFSRQIRGVTYQSFIVEYFKLGKRKQEWRSDLSEAKEAAQAACDKISEGNQSTIELSDLERLEYLRATEALAGTGHRIDVAATSYADALQILGGKASLAEACRDWVKRNAIVLPEINVPDACGKIQAEAITDGKSALRQKQLFNVLDRLSKGFVVSVQSVTPNLISAYLAALPLSERTKRNHRDVIGFFNRWLVLRGYLTKGTDWLEGVQTYTARKLGEIEIYTPDEIRKILAQAGTSMLAFIAIGAFAGLRHAEICRLDWSEIDLEDGFIEVRASKSKTGERRLVPISANLKKWLLTIANRSGKVVRWANTTKQIVKLAARAGIKWKKNALRHSAISYRVAECGEKGIVAEEAGNSVQVIKANYLRRVRPAIAAEWFSIVPTETTT